jgi:hypothetical protein
VLGGPVGGTKLYGPEERFELRQGYAHLQFFQ